MDDLTGTKRRGLSGVMARYAGAACLLAGVTLIAIGLVSVVRSLLAGLGVGTTTALAIAITTAGLAVPVILIGIAVRLDDAGFRREAGAGVATAIGGVTVFLLAAAAGWSGGLSIGVALASVVYTVGIAVLSISLFVDAVRTDDGAPTVSGVRTSHSAFDRTRTPSGSDRPSAHPTDGGDEDDEMEFLLEDDDRR